jgi:hypothetical protein
MNKRKFIETIANIVNESHLAIARRPRQECPFKHSEAEKPQSKLNIEKARETKEKRN